MLEYLYLVADVNNNRNNDVVNAIITKIKRNIRHIIIDYHHRLRFKKANTYIYMKKTS